MGERIKSRVESNENMGDSGISMIVFNTRHARLTLTQKASQIVKFEADNDSVKRNGRIRREREQRHTSFDGAEALVSTCCALALAAAEVFCVVDMVARREIDRMEAQKNAHV